MVRPCLTIRTSNPHPIQLVEEIPLCPSYSFWLTTGHLPGFASQMNVVEWVKSMCTGFR